MADQTQIVEVSTLTKITRGVVFIILPIITLSYITWATQQYFVGVGKRSTRQGEKMYIRYSSLFYFLLVLFVIYTVLILISIWFPGTIADLINPFKKTLI